MSHLHKWKQYPDGTRCELCAEPYSTIPDKPRRIERTKAGPQTVIDDTPARSIPETKLKTRRAQTDAPLPLELAEIEAKEPKLF